jgi:hypothetical protein
MNNSYLLAAALALGMVPGRAAANDVQARGAAGTHSSSASAEEPKANDSTPGCGATSGAGTGGSGNLDCSQCQCGEPATGGTGASMGTESVAPAATPSESNVTVIPVNEEPSEKRRASAQGLSVQALGGIEGYTSSLAPRINPGATYGVMITAQSAKIFGLELGYSGANNLIVDGVAPANARVIRNGGAADLKISLLPGVLEPFFFGGVGINRADIRNNAPGSGYQDDTFGTVPLGGGFNYRAGHFLVGARGSYDILFSNDYTSKNPGNTWAANLQMGGSF